jgi:hypothetical protein
MTRREFITLLRRGGSMAACGTSAAAGDAGDRFLGSTSSDLWAIQLRAFRKAWAKPAM